MNMTTEPIAAYTGQLEPEWCRVAQALAWSGMGRTRLYELINSGKIKTVSLRAKGDLRGTRLVSLPSLRQYIAKLATGGEDPR